MAVLTPTGGGIMEDGTYVITLGDAWDGTAPTFATDTINAYAIIKEATLSQKYEKSRVNAGGQKRFRLHSAEDELTIKFFSPLTNELQLTRGLWIKLATTTLDTTAVASPIQGVITDFKLTISQGEPVYQDVTITLNADVVS